MLVTEIRSNCSTNFKSSWAERESVWEREERDFQTYIQQRSINLYIFKESQEWVILSTILKATSGETSGKTARIEITRLLWKIVLAAGELWSRFSSIMRKRNTCKKAAARYVKERRYWKAALGTKGKWGFDKRGKEEEGETQSEDNNTQTQTKRKMMDLWFRNISSKVVVVVVVARINLRNVRNFVRFLKKWNHQSTNTDSPLPTECTKTPLPKNWRDKIPNPESVLS